MALKIEPEMLRALQSRHVVLDAAAIARAGASDVLAIDRAAIGKSVALVPAEPHRPQGVVAVVPVRGPLAQRAIHDMCGYVDGYDAVAARFEKALADTTVNAVLLDMDSPGGDVAGLEQCVERMKIAATRSGKPVHAFINECACSAAYWIVAAVASEVTIPPAGRAGSIGCIGGIVDETKALEMAGLSVTLVRWPEGKAESHPAGPVQPLAEERLAARVKAAGERFFAAMAKARPALSATKLMEMNGDVLEGKDAVTAGLVDKVGDFERALEGAATAGRKWRRQSEKAMEDQKRFEELQAFEQTVLTTFGAKDQKSAIGAMTAAKQAADEAPALRAELAANRENMVTLQKKFDDAEARRMIDAAAASMKIAPANREKTFGFYEEFGLKALSAFIERLSPIAPAASLPPPAPAPAVPPSNPAAPAAPAASVTAETKRYEQMRPIEKHAFRSAHGDAAYAALKQDWISRGKPAATV